MTIEISTALKNSLLASGMKSKIEVNEDNLSLGDGDGAGGLDTINSAGGGLDVFGLGSFLLILTPDLDVNRNKIVKVLSVASTKIEVAADSFTAFSGQRFIIMEPDIAGSFASIFRNCTIHFFKESRPSSGADAAEPGSPIVRITLNGGSFAPGIPTNGLNFGDMVDSKLRRAIDPATGNQELWSGTPTESSAANSFRCYANNVITGESIVSIRFDGSITGNMGGGDMTVEPSNSLSTSTPVNVTDVNVELRPTALL